MANGICDVQDCKNQTYMGWRPLSEKIGRQVCEHHWCRHNDDSDNFNLFDAFGFPRLFVVQTGSSWQTNSRPALRRCICGAELSKGYQYCQKCAKERERGRKREYRRKKQAKEGEALKSEIAEGILKCKICGQDRKHGHSYCERCAKQRKKERDRIKKRKRRNIKTAGVPTLR